MQRIPRRAALRSHAGAAWRHAREYAPTFATEFVILASQILTYKLAAHDFGTEGFSEFAVARRAISAIYPVCLLGLGVALPRYAAYSAGTPQAGNAARFFGAALSVVGIATLLIAGAMHLWPGEFAFLVFGSERYRMLAGPISLVIAGLAFHAVVYAHFRGELAMARANVLQFINIGILPMVAIVAMAHRVGDVLAFLGVATIAVTLIALSAAPWRSVARNSYAEARTLLRFGLPRVPGDFALMALLGLPAFVVAHMAGVERAGSIAFGISMLSMMCAAFMPIGLILLPKASRMFAEGTLTELRRHVWLLAEWTVGVGAVLTVIAFTAAGPFIRVYLGPGYEEVVIAVQRLSIGVVPYALFLVFRNVVDAYHEHAVTSLFVVMALALFSLGAGAVLLHWVRWEFLLTAFLGSLVLLGTLTTVQVIRILRAPRIPENAAFEACATD